MLPQMMALIGIKMDGSSTCCQLVKLVYMYIYVCVCVIERERDVLAREHVFVCVCLRMCVSV
jgi:hypothetical protein